MSAIPATKPEAVIAALLVSAPLGSIGTLGTNIFEGPVRPPSRPPETTGVPRNAIFCFPYFSFQPRPYFGSNNRAFRDIRVTVYIRNTEYVAGRVVCLAVWSALQQRDIHTGSPYPGYFSCTVAESDATYFGFSDKDDHRWELTAELRYKG